MQKNAILFKRLTNNLKNTATLKTLNTKLLNTLTTTFPNPLRLNICNKFYISKPQLCRIFKNETACTVSGYITTKRLIIAREIISNGIPPRPI